MKFKSLCNQTVIEARASDHHPIMMGNICTFNMLCRCNVNSRYANNGFSQSETAEDYRERLVNKLIPVIRELIEVYHIKIFAFQEAPPLVLTGSREDELVTFGAAKEFYLNIKNSFKDYIIDPVYYKSMWDGIDACGLLLMYHSSYKIKQELLLDRISEKNKSRSQAVHLICNTRDNQTPLKLVNIHADFHNQDGTMKDIQALVNNGFVVAGDFNLKICPKIKCYSQNIQTTAPGLMPYDTYDGIFSGAIEWHDI